MDENNKIVRTACNNFLRCKEGADKEHLAHLFGYFGTQDEWSFDLFLAGRRDLTPQEAQQALQLMKDHFPFDSKTHTAFSNIASS